MCRDARASAHVDILLGSPAYAMWTAVAQWMAHSALVYGPATALRQLAWIELDDVVLRASAARRLRLRFITA